MTHAASSLSWAGSPLARRPTRETLALVLAGGRGSRLGALTDWRAKPAVPFGGKFRIIDFALSNCINSDIRKILVLTQYKSHSLVKHLLNGWAFLNSERGEFLDIVPAQQWLSEEGWYRGTADAVYQSLDIISGYGPKYVLILAGDHVYSMDYGEMLAVHMRTQADVTIACSTVPLREAQEFGVMEADDSGRIVGFIEKPKSPRPMPGRSDIALVSMGVYIFLADYLVHQLRQDAQDPKSSHDFGKNIIPRLLAQGYRVQAYYFGSSSQTPYYWRDVGTIDAYFKANMELIESAPPFQPFDPAWPTTTYQPASPASVFLNGVSECSVSNSIVSNGCVVRGSRLDHSILFWNCRVDDGCRLERAIVLPGSEIREGARVRNAILDNRSLIPRGMVIGEEPEQDRARFDVTPEGIVLVTPRSLGQGMRYQPGLASGG